MKVRIVASILLLVLFFSWVEVIAFEVNIEGHKGFWTGLNLMVEEDEKTGEKIYNTSWSLGQSLDIHLAGERGGEYIRGYLTDRPELMEQIYLDIFLKNFTLQLDTFNHAFLDSSWFNPEQELRGVRSGYLGSKDMISLIGMKGDTVLREDIIPVNPGDEEFGLGLYHAPVVLDSIQAWLDGRELIYGEEFSVIDYQSGILVLHIPILKPGILRVKYLEQGQSYFVYGGRYDRNFGPALDGGLVFLLNQEREMSRALVGSEWSYQVKPWWNLNVSAGLAFDNTLNESGWSYPESSEENGRKNFNWRMMHWLDLGGLKVNTDYQHIENNLNGLLYGGNKGNILSLQGQLDKDNFFLYHRQKYQWGLDDFLPDKNYELHLSYFTKQWVPTLYYSYDEKNGWGNQQGILELAYINELAKDRGIITYQMGLAAKSSAYRPLLEDYEPFIGLRYEKNTESGIGVKLFGANGWQFAQLQVDGKWSTQSINWEGALSYFPDYYRLEQNLSFERMPLNVGIGLINSRYLSKDHGFLSLETDFNWLDDSLWISFMEEKYGEISNRTYQIGFEKTMFPGHRVYGEVGVSSTGNSYRGGVRGVKGLVSYDINYSHSFEEIPLEEKLWEKDEICYSFEIPDYWTFYGCLGKDSQTYWWKEMGLKYPLTPRLELDLEYSAEKSLIFNHSLLIKTIYYF